MAWRYSLKNEKELRKKIGTKLKDYMNAEEANSFLFLKITAVFMEMYRGAFMSHGNISKEEHKNLKMAITYLTKFTGSIQERLSKKQSDFFEKKIGKYEIKILDEYTLKRMKGDWEKELGIVKMKRQDYENWCNEIMVVKCKNCAKNHSECSLHDHFLENFVPESSWNLTTCRYAYKDKYTLIPKGTKANKRKRNVCKICNEQIDFNNEDVYRDNYDERYMHVSCAKEKARKIYSQLKKAE